jgi:hypothetical protein
MLQIRQDILSTTAFSATAATDMAHFFQTQTSWPCRAALSSNLKLYTKVFRGHKVESNTNSLYFTFKCSVAGCAFRASGRIDKSLWLINKFVAHSPIEVPDFCPPSTSPFSYEEMAFLIFPTLSPTEKLSLCSQPPALIKNKMIANGFVDTTLPAAYLRC